jgi:hypothetical protein
LYIQGYIVEIPLEKCKVNLQPELAGRAMYNFMYGWLVAIALIELHAGAV